MSELIVQSGKGTLRLSKSKNLVGLRTKQNSALEEKDYVEQKVFKNIGGFEIVALHEAKDVDSKLDEVRQKEEIEVGTHVYHSEGSDKPLVPTGEIILEFEEGVGPQEQQLVLDEFYLELSERRSATQVIAKVTAQSPNPIKVANFLQKISLVKRAEPDLDALLEEYDIRLPSDNLLAHQWYFKNTGFIVDTRHPTKTGADAKILDAWSKLGSTGSSNIVLAIIDNGFDLSHPDLRDKVYRPFDLWSNSSNVLQGDVRFTHGTPCASVALASANGSGIVGVAPNSKFMPVSGTSFSLRATEQMFDYCLRNGADIISCSWGTTDPNFSLNSMKEEAISKAARLGRNGKGCVILFAVGNENKDMISHYAAHPEVIAVAATTSQDEHAGYSNRGRQISVSAPSNGDWPIIAARASWDPGTDSRGPGDFRYWADGKSRGQYYKHFGGTSSATPLVAGICALMLSANPDLTAKEVKQILESTADKVGNSWEYNQGHSVKYGFGRVNAAKAVEEALRRKGRPSTSTTPVPKPQPTPRPDTSTPPVVKPPTDSTPPNPSAPAGQNLYRFDVEKQAASGYGVQIGVFADYANVLEQSELMGRRFRQPVIVKIEGSTSNPSFKMVLGAFATNQEALSLLNQLRSMGINGFVRNLRDFS